MSGHLPECPNVQPWCDDEQFPEHGFCGNFVGRCLYCIAACICDALRACEERVTAAAVQRVEALFLENLSSNGFVGSIISGIKGVSNE